MLMEANCYFSIGDRYHIATFLSHHFIQQLVFFNKPEASIQFSCHKNECYFSPTCKILQPSVSSDVKEIHQMRSSHFTPFTHDLKHWETDPDLPWCGFAVKIPVCSFASSRVHFCAQLLLSSASHKRYRGGLPIQVQKWGVNQDYFENVVC